MYRQEFIDEVTTMGSLLRFCYDMDIDICEDIYSEDSKNEYVDDCLVDWARSNCWQELYDLLASIPTGYEYYLKDDWDDWQVVDDEIFEDKKQEVLDLMDDGDYWDEEITEEDDDDNIEIEDDEDATEDNNISLTELFTSCRNEVTLIESAIQQTNQALREEFEAFVTQSIPNYM